MNDLDHAAYERMPLTQGREHMIKRFGNHQSMENFRQQQCPVCGKRGLECIGHPMVLDMSSFEAIFLSEFGYTTMKKLASVFCSMCKQFVRPKTLDESSVQSSHNDLARTDGVAQAARSSSVASHNDVDRTHGAAQVTHSGPNQSDGAIHGVKSLAELMLLKPAALRCGCEGTSYTKFTFEIPKITEETKRSTLDQPVIEALYEVAQTAVRDPFISSLINTDNVLHLFYDKYVMLPTMLHVKFTDTGLTSQQHNEIEMIKAYLDMMDKIQTGGDNGLREIKKNIHDLSVAVSEKKFLGTPSHLKIANGKEGIYRDFAQNPRAWGTTRAVLTDGSDRSGVMQCPFNIMKNQYYTYVVAPHNKEWLQHKVIQGVVTHMVLPIEASSTNRYNEYRALTSKYTLKLGDVVIKRVETGDFIVMNRHPTLWKHSMLGYRVAIWDKPCFGMNETNTKGHNADFDGDEGNGQVPHSTTGRVEAAMIQAQYNLFGSHNGDPVVTILYNGIIGMYELSTDDHIDKELFDRLLGHIRAERYKQESPYIRDLVLTDDDLRYYESKAKRHGVPYRSGRTLISMLFPRGFYYKRGDVRIEDGFLVEGVLQSKDISYEIVKAIALIDRFTAPYLIVDVGYVLASEYISAKGMMISASDYIAPGPPDDAGQESDAMHSTSLVHRSGNTDGTSSLHRSNASSMLRGTNDTNGSSTSGRLVGTQGEASSTQGLYDRKIRAGTLYDRSSIMPDTFQADLDELNRKVVEKEKGKIGQTQPSAERTEQSIVDDIDKFIGKYEKLLKETTFKQRNISKISFRSGARGNIGQIMAAVSFVGQQYADSDRLGLDTERLSYYSAPDSKSIYDRGFVKNSFTNGLSPHEVMMLAGPARRAAFRTYLGTPGSGHISRQTILHTCGMKVNNHLSTEDRIGTHIETLYGYGCDAAYVSKRDTVFGGVESAVDPVLLLKYFNARRGL